MKTIEIEQDLVGNDGPKVLASAIVKLSAAAEQLAGSGLNRRALVLLLKDASGVPQYAITKVLDALPRLSELYVSKPTRQAKTKEKSR